MATSDKDQGRSFSDCTNRRKASDGNSQRLGAYHRQRFSCTGNPVIDRASSSGRSRGPQTFPTLQAKDPALGTTLVPKRLAGQHQSDKIKMNKDSNTSVKKSGTNSTSVSRLSKKENTTQPPKVATSLFKRRGTTTLMQSKQQLTDTLKGTGQPLKDPAGLTKKNEISRIGTLIQAVKKKVTTPSSGKPKMLENARNSGILASKHVMQNKEKAQPLKDSPQLIKNGGTGRITASKHVMQKRDKAQHPKNPVGLVKNVGISIIPSSMHSVQKNKTIHLQKGSASSVKKIETTARNPTLKQIQKKEKNQPSKGSAGVVSRSGTSRSLPSRLFTHRKETTFDNQRQKQRIYEDHIVWEGFDDRIVPLGMNCLLCECDLANEPEYGPDREGHNPAENAVLSCGHVFHSQCLLLTIAEEKCRDPPCIICASISS